MKAKQGENSDYFLPLSILLVSLFGKTILSRYYPIIWKLQMGSTVILCVSMAAYYLFAIRNKHFSSCNAHSSITVWVQFIISCFICICITSSLLQSIWLDNLIYAGIYSLMIYVLLIKGAEITGSKNIEKVVELICLIIIITSIVSLIMIPFKDYALFRGNRLNGVYCNSIVSGQMYGLGCLLISWRIRYYSNVKGKWILGFLACLLCLILSRTRTSLVATVIGISVIYLYASIIDINKHKLTLVKSICVTFGVILSVLLLVYLFCDSKEIDTAKEYFRISDSPDEIAMSRLEYWESGTNYLDIQNLFGKGPLDKYGGAFSNEGSGYLRNSNSHNAFLSAFQYYGVIGGGLFIIMNVVFLFSYLQNGGTLKILGVGVLTFGLIQCVSENWLLTFATPLDTFSWYLLGLTLIKTKNVPCYSRS